MEEKRPSADFVLEYKGYFAKPAAARILVFVDVTSQTGVGLNGNAKRVVLYTTPPPVDEYTGLSISNGSERIATELFHAHNFTHEVTEYVEFYPGPPITQRDGGESFAFVMFEAWTMMQRYRPGEVQLTATDRVWVQSDRETVEKLIGGAFHFHEGMPIASCLDCAVPVYIDDTVAHCADCGGDLCPGCAAPGEMVVLCHVCKVIWEKSDHALD